MTGTNAAASAASDALSAAEYLEDQLKQRGLDQLQLAELTGVSRQTINAIVRGRQPISRAMSAKLGKLFGQPPDFWLREQFRRASRKISDSTEISGAPAAQPTGQIQTGPASRSTILTDHEIHQAIADGIISIDPLVDANINAASLDLCLGRVDALGRQSEAHAGAVIEIAPLECAHAWSRETVRLPANMMARVGPMARLSHLGLFLGHGLQVDPGFEGELAFALFNASPNPISLRIGDPVLSLELVELAAPSQRPIDTVEATGDFADRAASQFSGSSPGDRVKQHLRNFLETTGLEASGTHVSRIRGTGIEVESEDRKAAQNACIETCLRVIRDEAESELRRREKSGRWDQLEQLLGEMKLGADDFDILLREATIIDQDNGSATIARPDRQKLTIPYPGPAISVRVRQLSGPMHLDASAFVIVQYLLSGGSGMSLFPEVG